MFLLNSQNVFNYLGDRNFCDSSEQSFSKVEPLAAKNFNLLITFPDKRKLLVKQERQNLEGKAAGEFKIEYRIQEWLQRFPEVKNLDSVLPELLHFDRDNAIMVFKYLDDYQDLSKFYLQESSFAIKIASTIGTLLATIHRHSYEQDNHRQFFLNEENSQVANQVPQLIRGLERITPEIFGAIPADGLKFFALYQKYDSLGVAIVNLGAAFTPSCLTHNDLKLNNILLHTDWQQTDDSIIRIIDWERSGWGDPAFDLGTLFASYIQKWLGSLVMSKSLSIEESLSLAVTPLEQLQPSIAALTKAYLNTFSEILEHRPDFLQIVVQFAGFGLIQQIQAMIQYQKSFGNMGIAMLQVAKSLLCRPERSMPTLFGKAIVEIAQLCTAA
ncbi:LPS biosynthesis choline kinase [Hyella patelloides LEGE 07179]|uniref:LPS biosynthesis choline kinase n=2 Tax=Hyella TaxID=945733 RepID=A0A563VSD8_9CYAN|nr:phosphotransferase [Hyella patelloides]VEP14321.1 LPS biosynthesis choline kinase [Hyella patelloides LEGE 07179]